MIEAPEGIVAYSWSGTNPYGRTGIQVGVNAFIDTTDTLGQPYGGVPDYRPYEYLQLTDSIIETLDLISEGVIESPLSGKWIFSGNLGQTGWSSAYFSGYQTPAGYEDLAWLRSVYWNQIPVLNDVGQFNFQNIDVKYTQGTPNGDIIQELTNEETTSQSIGLKLYSGDENAQVYRILNQNCKGVIVNIRVPSLTYTDPNTGNIQRVLIQYQISYRPIFSSINKVTQFNPPIPVLLFGKISAAGGYVNSTRIDFNLTSFLQNNISILEPNTFLNDPDFIGWEIRIVKITPDSASSLTTNSIYIDSLTQLYGSQLSYPNSALIRSTFDAKYFSQIPSRAFECNFIKVKIPANYDPIMRTYATTGYGTTNGFWDGTFASGKAWTNNPAWCFYDLITNNRYGLGKFVDNIDIYKFDLYNIAQYCDELVADGYGGLEPRFTCNVWIAQKEDAFKVINDIASIFRGMIYYFNGNLNAIQDGPKTPRITFTNANVENGDFNYNSTSKKTRQSVAAVRYNDPKNFYQPAIEYVENLDAIRKYGVRELPIVAFGCTSRGQAIRLGRWALYSNNLETETVTFNAGLETNLLRCGDVFEIVNFNRKLKRYGGRIYQLNNTGYTGIGFTGAQIILDSNIDLSTGIQYNISIVTPTFYYDPSQVTGLTSNDYGNMHRSFLQSFSFSGDNTFLSGQNTVINLNTGLNNIDYNISGNPIWSIELGPNSLNYTGNYYFTSPDNDYYRVLNIKELDIHKYEIVGLKYDPEKFAQIDTGLVFQSNQISNLFSTPTTPRNLQLSSYSLSNSRKYISYQFIVDDYSNISNYKVYVTTGNFIGNSIPNDSFLGGILPASIVNADYFVGSHLSSQYSTGQYLFRVYSYNSNTNTYSTGCASGSVSVLTTPTINDLTIGGLILK